ncbi:MAG: hypothetical protein JWM16_306 [Verrucomicrobiales bacterium]|nr:hypothetical protein [Verrucomicrobiales bacterium]
MPPYTARLVQEAGQWLPVMAAGARSVQAAMDVLPGATKEINEWEQQPVAAK